MAVSLQHLTERIHIYPFTQVTVPTLIDDLRQKTDIVNVRFWRIVLKKSAY